MKPSYYDRAHLPAFSSIGRHRGELAAKFFGWYGDVFAAGALGATDKALAALAVAHVVQCPYCIDAYTSGSLEKGADTDQLSEAIHIAALARAGSTLDFASQAKVQAAALELRATEAPPTSYFERVPMAGLEAAGGRTDLDEAVNAWSSKIMADGALEPETRAIIWVACGHALQCPYTIRRATEAALGCGLDRDALTEAVHVAAAIRGGASLIHGLQMLEIADAHLM